VRKRLIVVALATALGLLGLQGVASSDPEPCGQNPAGVCKGTNDPPPCPPRNDK
jgi:hypothetical protein